MRLISSWTVGLKRCRSIASMVSYELVVRKSVDWDETRSLLHITITIAMMNDDAVAPADGDETSFIFQRCFNGLLSVLPYRRY